MVQKVRSGFTKTGFSKSFGCCGHFRFCEMGKGTCFYAEKDPEVQESCHAWLRNHSEQPQKPRPSSRFEENVHQEKIEAFQLSLFD